MSAPERQAVLDVLHSERFIDQSPAEVHATLLEEQRYLCAPRTMYRVLAAAKEVRERRAQARHLAYTTPELVATRPNQVWSWDITKLKGPIPYLYYSLYVILDLFSRYAVGWMVARHEIAHLAERLIAATCLKQGIAPHQLTIHADRGAPMRSKLVALHDRIAQSIRVIPGVRSVSVSRAAFLSCFVWSSTLYVQGRGGEGFNSHMMSVSLDFFETMGIPLLTERTFAAQDSREAPAVVLINATAARELFGDENPLGRSFGFSPEERHELEIIGVVQDVQYRTVRDAVPPTTYRSAVQSPLPDATFMVRTAGPPSALTIAVRDAL